MSVKVIIPARYASSRFPGKPLAEIGGVPMVVRVADQCSDAVPVEDVYVATDDSRIARVVEQRGYSAVDTSSLHPTGTDRVAEAIETIEGDRFVLVQGDEPLIKPEDIQALIKSMSLYRGTYDVYGGYCHRGGTRYNRFSTVKVALGYGGRLLYASRALIPAQKSGWLVEDHGGNVQVGIYGFTRKALERATDPRANGCLRGYNEACEDVEILRFLERGIPVHMVRMEGTATAVDDPVDLREVNRMLGYR